MTLIPCGIYIIKNIKNNKVYVGQSQNVYNRREQHFAALEKGKHPNKKLQRDYKIYGKSNFTWEFKEYCGMNELNEREHYWIEKLNSIWPHGYNIDWKPYKRKEVKTKTDVKKKSYRYKGYRRRS